MVEGVGERDEEGVGEREEMDEEEEMDDEEDDEEWEDWVGGGDPYVPLWLFLLDPDNDPDAWVEDQESPGPGGDGP
jgi:hypothetical protein